MATILGVLFLGVSILAHHLRPYPSEQVTVFAQMGKQVFGDNFVFWFLQLATAGILTLAANTAYADFPRLSSIIARDGYLPRQLANRGDRLVFSNGVIVLALLAGTLIALFGAKTNALIPLYAVGVFVSFTLSQAGMVRHHQKEHEPHWRRSTVINGVGAVATAIVAVIIASTKFLKGAWVPLVVIPIIVVLFKSIKRHYDSVTERLRVSRRLQAAPHEPHGRRARRRRAPRRPRSARVREVARAQPSDRDDDRLRRGGAGDDRADLA